MSYTVNKLITDAYYTSDIVSREFESVSGTQAAEGLLNLNFLLDEKTVDKGMIPYVSTLDSVFVVGQEDYYIQNLIEAYTLTFTIGKVRYSTRSLPRDQYFGSSRANDINSLPFSWNVEREFGGATLRVYFSPDKAYSFELKGLFRLSSVTQFQDLELTIDGFYRNFLIYELAETLCDKFGYTTPPNVTKRLAQMRKRIDKISQPMDMSIKRISALAPNYSVNYAYANLGTGFVPSVGKL